MLADRGKRRGQGDPTHTTRGRAASAPFVHSFVASLQSHVRVSLSLSLAFIRTHLVLVYQSLSLYQSLSVHRAHPFIIDIYTCLLDISLIASGGIHSFIHSIDISLAHVLCLSLSISFRSANLSDSAWSRGLVARPTLCTLSLSRARGLPLPLSRTSWARHKCASSTTRSRPATSRSSKHSSPPRSSARRS